MGAIQFIENMDRTTLTISDDEFEHNVEAAVSAIAEKHRLESPTIPQPEKSPLNLQAPAAGESASRRASSDVRPSLDIDAPGTPRKSTSSNEGGGASGEYTASDEKAAITGLLRTIQKPLSTIGRMFSDDAPAGSSSPSAATTTNPPVTVASPALTPQPASSPRLSAETPSSAREHRHRDGHGLSAEDAAARQASAEAAEAQRLHRAEHANIVETLAGMFPDLDRDIISDVVYQKEGR